VFGVIKRELRRRSAIEPVIGHMKAEGHLGRCYLKGRAGDAADTAAAMTAALGCSGFVSYDFMLDEEQGRASLIEMNPRCVGSSHLGRQFGHDICGALVAELAGSSAPKQLNPPTTKLVALFPKELERDPSSPYLHSLNVLHDVPRDDPDVISAYLRRLTELHPSRAQAIVETVQRLLTGPQAKIAN
jgi:hypothetical protein